MGIVLASGMWQKSDVRHEEFGLGRAEYAAKEAIHERVVRVLRAQIHVLVVPPC